MNLIRRWKPRRQNPSASCTFLALRKGRAAGLSAIACSAALDIHMVCDTFIIAVVNALYRLTVNTDGAAGML